jgi:hypothetical protein
VGRHSSDGTAVTTQDGSRTEGGGYLLDDGAQRRESIARCEVHGREQLIAELKQTRHVELVSEFVVFSREVRKKLKEVTQQVLDVADVTVLDELELLQNRLDKQHVAVKKGVVHLEVC